MPCPLFSSAGSGVKYLWLLHKNWQRHSHAADLGSTTYTQFADEIGSLRYQQSAAAIRLRQKQPCRRLLRHRLPQSPLRSASEWIVLRANLQGYSKEPWTRADLDLLKPSRRRTTPTQPSSLTSAICEHLSGSQLRWCSLAFI